jgi:hypothetical protein
MKTEIKLFSIFLSVTALFPSMKADPFTDLYKSTTQYLYNNPKKTRAAALTIIVTFLARQYYKHKKRPRSETLTPEARTARLKDIKSEKNILKKDLEKK